MTGEFTSEVRDLFRTVGPKTVSAVLKAKIFRQPTPVQIIYEVTHLCNLECEYCDRHTPLPNELEFDDVSRIIDEFVDLGMVGMTLDGGDPLVRGDIHKIVDKLSSLGVRIVINTNAILIPPKLESVKKAALVNVSLDGHEAHHDSMRGKGSFQKAIRGIEAARRAGVTVKLRCTVHRENAGSIPELVKLAEAVDSPIMFQPALNSLFLDTDRDGGRWQPAANEFHDAILWLCEEKKHNRYIANRYASLKHFLSFPEPKEPPCSAGWIHATMDPEGYLYHCGQVNRASQRINVTRLGARAAFERIQRYGCGTCWCASLLDTNYIWGGKLRMFTSSGIPPRSAAPAL